MKTLYIEPFCGVAGDMLVASLSGLGLDFVQFKNALSSLPVEENWEIDLSQVSRHALNANLFSVKIDLLHNHHHSTEHSNSKNESSHTPNHHKHHHHRSLPEINEIIRGAKKLSKNVKNRACAVFAKLAEAEAEVHGKDITAVHFHEVGAVDAIVDITGTCLALEMLKIDHIIATPIALGTGTVHSAHGVLPVPVPATLNLIRGLPTENTGIKSELATPTGAALLATLVNEWNTTPKGSLIKSSYGAGTRDLKERAAVLRVSLYEMDSSTINSNYSEDEVAVIECNIDDMPGEQLSWVASEIMKINALDCTLIPVTMKKGRPGIILQVICKYKEVAKFADFILKETTTLGVRYRIEKRFKLNREIRKIVTPYGTISAKFATDNSDKLIKVKPEFEDIAKLAENSDESYSQIYKKITNNIQVH